MCDYCDCRSVELIDQLGHEHSHLLQQASRVRAQALVGDIAEARRTMAHLIEHLQEHTRTEEIALFPALQESGMEQTADELIGDHRAVDQLIVDADNASDAEWPSIAVELLAVLADHIRREEYDVFPAAVQLVAPARWDGVHEQALRLVS